MNATARNADQWFTLDRDWTITDCGDGIPGVVAQTIGKSLWDSFPGSEPLFRPVYERAWETGCASETVYWNDTITNVHAMLRGDVLCVTVDYLTVAGLRATLSRIEAGASHREDDVSPQVRPTRLHLVSSDH